MPHPIERATLAGLLWIDCRPHLKILLLILLYSLYPRSRETFPKRVSFLPSARAHLIPVPSRTRLCRFSKGTKRNRTDAFCKNNKNRKSRFLTQINLNSPDVCWNYICIINMRYFNIIIHFYSSVCRKRRTEFKNLFT